MGYYLLDHQNPHAPMRANGKRMFAYPTRNKPILAGVIHITAGLQDMDGDFRADSSAEDTAHYAATTTREVSWHSGSDSNSSLRLLPDEYTAFQCVGYNSCTIGHEISKRDITWADENPEWVRRTLQEAADCLRPRYKKLKVPIKHITKAQLDRAIARGVRTPVGLIGHMELDPDRRRDPGYDFPWVRFLGMLAKEPAPLPPKPTPVPPQPAEEEVKFKRFIVNDYQQYLALPEGLLQIKNQQHLGLLIKADLVADGEPIAITEADVKVYGVLS